MVAKIGDGIALLEIWLFLCGGCSFCGTASPTPSPTPNPTPAPSANPTPSPAGECKSWCEADYNGNNNQGRHCAPGNMAYLCGGCSFCGTSSPPPTPTPPTTSKPTPAPTPSTTPSTTSNPTPAP